MFTESDFQLYAVKNYINSRCTVESEFKDDLNRFKYLKKLLDRYIRGDDISIVLIINHLVILFNVFSKEACLAMLFYKLEEFSPQIKTILTHLNAMPDYISELNLYNSDIQLDIDMIDKLRELKWKTSH